MDFGSKSIRTESITEKKETTFQMDSVLMDFRGKSIRTESIYGKQIKKETNPNFFFERFLNDYLDDYLTLF